MLPKFAKLVNTKDLHPVKEDSAFWKQLQRSLLLGLKEQGRLSELQYRYALEHLRLSPGYLSENES